MEIENLIQSAKMVEAIKLLTTEVKELQKFGVQLLNTDSCNNSLFELKIPTGAPILSEQQKASRRYQNSMMGSFFSVEDKQPIVDELPEYHILQQKLTQETMLRILQLMLDEKNHAIKMFEMQLSAMGVKF